MASGLWDALRLPFTKRLRPQSGKKSSTWDPGSRIPGPLLNVPSDRYSPATSGGIASSCYFMSLPLELRHCIYELALGGRVISLTLVASELDGLVQSACYEPVDDPDSANKLDVPADRITVALLLSCRQVYLEALPIMHQRNTFHFYSHEFKPVVLIALGHYCLPDIRSVYLLHSHYKGIYAPNWTEVADLLSQMRLESLAFEFKVDRVDWAPVELHKPVLDGWWSSRVVKIRNLRRFDILFTDGDLPKCPTYRTDAVQRFRDLMIGPRADERYRTLLEERQEETRLAQQG
ncbi:hypothetical protein DFH09DRAFT_1119241 [Mycena vulgaris]|nr:hypothetical protein DFH09DRAFT_1119241 [Mycena vulgaris]